MADTQVSHTGARYGDQGPVAWAPPVESVADELNRFTAIDWQVKEDVQHEMKKRIRRQLRVAGITATGRLDRVTGELMRLARARS